MNEILKPVQIEDMDEAIDLARRSYPEKSRRGAVASLSRHKQFMEAGLDDNANQFKVVSGDDIVGVCGLYKRGDFCPKDVIWGDWFFVDPERRNPTLAYRMGVELIKRAKKLCYRLMCVETTNYNLEYFNIEPYLLRFGFKPQGNLVDYFEEGVDLQYFSLDLQSWEPGLGRK